MKNVQKIKIFLASLGIFILLLTQPSFLLIAESSVSPFMEELSENSALFFEGDSSFEKTVEEGENNVVFGEELLLEDSLQILSEKIEQSEDLSNTPISLDHMLLVTVDLAPKSSAFSLLETTNRDDPLDGFELVEQIVHKEQISYVLQSDPAESEAAFFARVEEAFPQAQIQPNYRYELYEYTPNDPSYSSLRAFSNTQWPKVISALLDKEDQYAPIVAVVDI